jgi:hypothetical protein
MVIEAPGDGRERAARARTLGPAPPLAAACALVLAAVLAGCGPDIDEYALLRPDAGYPDAAILDQDPGATNWIEDDPLEDWDTTAAGPLSGIYAVEVIVSLEAIVAVQARQLARWRLLQHGTKLRIRSQLCRLGMPSVPGVAEISVPLALEKVLRAKVVDTEGEYLSSAEPAGAELTAPEMLTILGASLVEPGADPLPTADDPENALDEDADGHPGVTLAVEALTCGRTEWIYGAVRSSARLAGKVESEERLLGDAEPRLEQSVLGMSDDCLAAATELPIEILPGSTFLAVRVGLDRDVNHNGNVTCGELVVAAPELFGPYWSGG